MAVDVKQLDQILDKCGKIIKRHIPDQAVRLDFESKIYSGGLTQALLLVNNYLPKKESLILDIGCGKGHISVLLASLGYSVHAIDIEETKGEQLEISEKKWQQSIWTDLEKAYPHFNLKYQFYNGIKIPFQNESFDGVMAYAVIEHAANYVNFLIEANRVLKKGGQLFIFRCPRKQSGMEYAAQLLKMSHHEKLMDEKELEEALRTTGFQKIRMEISDLVPAFPPVKLQRLWNDNSRIINLADKTLLKSPLKHIAHHMNFVCNKI